MGSFEERTASQGKGRDITQSLGRAIVVIIGAIAELERSLIVERVRAGMRRAKLEGRHIGRKPLDLDLPSCAIASSARALPSWHAPTALPAQPSTAYSIRAHFHLLTRTSHD